MMQKKPYLIEEIQSQGETKARLLCLHGLNQNPKALKSFLSDLSASGVQSFLIHLPGHHQHSDDSTVSIESINQSYREAYKDLNKQYGNIDYFLGYSYGGLIGCSLAHEISYKKRLLLAPALRIKGYTHALKLLLPFMRRIQSIPLGDPALERHYRFHGKGVPQEIYKSFFEHYRQFHLNPQDKKIDVATLVYCHPKDELISYNGLKRWVAKRESFEFRTLENSKADFKKYNHLCFDQRTLGNDQYQKLVQETLQFFNLV